MLDQVLAGLDFFKPKAITRHPGATEEQVAAAEEAVGCRFPPSMRAFLQLHDGALLPDLRVYGVAAIDETFQIVRNTMYWRERTGEPYVIIAGNQSGDDYALLTAEVGANGEYPIAMLDHETGYPMGIVASTYERFLWFALDDMKRSFRKDGEYRAAEVYGPWPFSDEAWVLRHDPDVARWRKRDEPPEPVTLIPELVVAAPEEQWSFASEATSFAPYPAQMMWLPDGELVIATRGTDVACGGVWDWSNGTLLGRLGPIELGLCAITAPEARTIYFAGTPTSCGVSVRPDSRSDWNALWLADWGGDKVLGMVEGESSACNRAAWEPGGRRIAITYDDGSVRVWNLASQATDLTMHHPTEAAAVCFSPDGSLLATAGRMTEKRNARAEVSVWCTTTGQRLHRLELGPEWIGNLVFSPDASRLALSRALPKERRQLDVWDLKTGQVKQISDLWACCFLFSPDGSLLLTNYSTWMRLWDVRTGAVKVEFGEESPASVLCLAAIPGEKRFIAARTNGMAEIWAIPDEIAWE